MVLENARVVIGALSGDSGKTLLAIGVLRALHARGLPVAAYKKGPDYIDAAWIGAAACGPGRNLDTYLMPPDALGASLGRARRDSLIVVEGNRGVHDGMDAAGTHSTAELAKRLGAPVVLVIDATKATRTLAACVHGCTVIDPDLVVGGVVLNRVATPRHERTVSEALAALGGPPVLGALPRVADDPLPSRHLGLVTAAEHDNAERAIQRAAELVQAHVDLDAIVRLAQTATAVALPDAAPLPRASGVARIGVLRDEAFSFCYPETIEAIGDAGGTIVEVSPLRDGALPDVDALYIGGGFPEVHVAALAANAGMLASVRAAARAGVPVYAECGGLMYLARELRVDGHAYAMAGALDIAVEQTPRPQGHGYVEAIVDAENPFFAIGTTLRGHEFHYSRLAAPGTPASALRLLRGCGIGGGRDGLVDGRIWAAYTHLHPLGTASLAPALVAAATRRQAEIRSWASAARDRGGLLRRSS